MKPKEPAIPFYAAQGTEGSLAGHFNVYRREDFTSQVQSPPDERRDFYKIWFITEGEGKLRYADRSVQVKAPALVFINPLFPYSWEPATEPQTGFFCLFTEQFMINSLETERFQLPALFQPGGSTVYFPDGQSAHLLASVFEYMIREMRSIYPHKYDLLRSYVEIIMHERLKSRPDGGHALASQASRRISNMFMELLERQFPLHRPTDTVPFRSAQDFARALEIHPNHLNKSLKEITGRTTTEWIAERLTREAGDLLRHSSWDISGIAFALGFEHPSNFTLFFKKATGESPKAYRLRLQSGPVTVG